MNKKDQKQSAKAIKFKRHAVVGLALKRDSISSFLGIMERKLAKAIAAFALSFKQ